MKLEPGKLLSRVIRTNIGLGKSGSALLEIAKPEADPAGIQKPQPRTINNLAKFQKNKLFSAVWDTGKVLVGWLGQAIGFVGFSFGAVFGFLLSAVESLKNFDWNASDKDLESGMQAQSVQIAGIWGGAVGAGLGWAASIAVGYGVGVVCPVIGSSSLARGIALSVADEALDEVTANFKNAIIQTLRVGANRVLVGSYINYRKLLKSLPDSVLANFYDEQTIDFIKNQWGSKSGPRMTFNEFMDERVESIKNPLLQAFVEEFLEEGWDSFVEAGFIIASELDSALEQSRRANRDMLGSDRSITVYPDAAVETEKLVFENIPQNLLIPAVQQSINTHRLVHNRDVGQIVGEPAEDYILAKPPGLRIKIQLYSVQAPPWKPRAGQSKVRRITVTIPDCKRSALDWNKIKLACGGVNGYLWGRFRAEAALSDGRPLIVYGATKEVAEDQLKLFATLCDSEIKTINVVEELKEGERKKNEKLYKESTRIYPGQVVIYNRDVFLDSSRGRSSSRQNFRDKRARLPLWTDEKPSNFDEVVQEILTFGTL